eukprot:5728039-Pleurochrysis_carterae.AAC.1
MAIYMGQPYRSEMYQGWSSKKHDCGLPPGKVSKRRCNVHKLLRDSESTRRVDPRSKAVAHHTCWGACIAGALSICCSFTASSSRFISTAFRPDVGSPRACSSLRSIGTVILLMELCSCADIVPCAGVGFTAHR